MPYSIVERQPSEAFSCLRTLVLLASLVTFLFAFSAHDLHLEKISAVDCEVCLVFGSVDLGSASTKHKLIIFASFQPVAYFESSWSAFSGLTLSSRDPPFLI